MKKQRKPRKPSRKQAEEAVRTLLLWAGEDTRREGPAETRRLGWLLFIVGTVYFCVITAQSLYGWYVWLTGGDKYIGLVRQYIIVQGLRLRFKTFWGDVGICILLCVAFLVIGHAHVVIDNEKRRRHGTCDRGTVRCRLGAG